jgi:hypothetical protein
MQQQTSASHGSCTMHSSTTQYACSTQGKSQREACTAWQRMCFHTPPQCLKCTLTHTQQPLSALQTSQPDSMWLWLPGPRAMCRHAPH